MSAVLRLHPHLQHAIVHDLMWRELRPVQEQTIEAVLDGYNTVVLAPTAGGKTEAAIFPALSRVLSEDQSPVAVLYVCPIRALLNNQEPRLQHYCRAVGLDAFKWHGDVSDSRRSRFREAPCHLLMTTPESLEVMLISARTDARALFAGLTTVVIDEVHAFAGDDRGAHLAALLERIKAIAERDVQRIGLSATVGNPQVIGQWLQGSSTRPLRVVDPPRPPAVRDIAIDYCDSLTGAAGGILRKARGKKSLVFVESRAKAERVAQSLSGGGVEVFIHHSSVSRADRTLAEEQFARGSNTAIVCTSTMELGIDVGDLDHVMQVDAPSTVASLLQRMGRTGRRPGTVSNYGFFCTSREALLQAVALAELATRGWVEDVRPAERATHVLAHQIMALALQDGGVSRHQVLPRLADAYPFSGFSLARLRELVDTMLERDILYEADGLLSLGKRGEALYGRKNFFELYAVFSSPPVLRVVHGRDEVGHVQAGFVLAHNQKDGRLCFRLAGRPWQVVRTDWNRATLYVEPAERGTVPSWFGPPSVLSFTVCQAILGVLVSDETAAELSNDARAELATVRAGYDGLLERGGAPLESTSEGMQWHTFAGGAINRLLSAGLEAVTHKQWKAGNLSVRCDSVSEVEVRQAIRQLPALDWADLATRRAREMARGPISKFQPCLPREAEDRLLANTLLDLQGTLRFLMGRRDRLVESAAAGVRLEDQRVDELPARMPVPVAPSQAYQPRNPIHLVETLAALEQAVAELRREPEVGLDVETTLDFGVVCLIQIASPAKTYVIDALGIAELRSLAPLLESPEIAKISHNARFEARTLARLGLAISNAVDTLEASRRRRGRDALGGHGLAAVCERELGIVLSKEQQVSDWTRRPLSPEQLLYAAVDAEVMLPLFERLGSRGD